jgi:hypothetical protein
MHYVTVSPPALLGARIAEVNAPVMLWHGLADTRCPPNHSRWLTGQLPHITAHFPETEDHADVEENNRPSAFAWLWTFATQEDTHEGNGHR